MIETVLLEFEGVLVETGAARQAALTRSLADEGLSLPPDGWEDACVGFPLREAAVAGLAACGTQRDETGVDLVVLRAERYFAESIGHGVALAPGAREFLEHAAGRARLGIVTRASRREVEFVLRLAALESLFEVIVTSEDVLAAKPSPEGYELALERLARRGYARPARIVALEDSLPGILAARAVKLRSVAVGTLPVHQAVPADALLPTLQGETLDSLAALVHLSQE